MTTALVRIPKNKKTVVSEVAIDMDCFANNECDNMWYRNVWIGPTEKY